MDAKSFTLEDWNNIRKIAFQLHERQELDGDDFKVAVAAFILWLEMHLDQPLDGLTH